MTCDRFERLVTSDRLTPEDEAALLAHLDSCPACAARTAQDEKLADPLVAAAGSAARASTIARRGASLLLAASVLLSIGLSVRTPRPPETGGGYLLSGDSTGVALTGPGVARRTDSIAFTTARRGDRT